MALPIERPAAAFAPRVPMNPPAASMRSKRIAEAILWLSSGAALFLAFAWPVAVSGDPASPGYERLAIVSFCGILGAIGWLAVLRALQARSSR